MTEPLSHAPPSEVKRAIISPVIDRMKGIDISGVAAELDRVHDRDQKAGIAIAHLQKPEVMTPVPPIETVDGEYYFHAARVFPGDGNFVNPHWHEVGEEPYLILAGQDGEINLGRIVDGQVVWDAPRPVQQGEVIVVEEGQVHSLRNRGDKPYDFLFACPHSHITDKTPENPQGDRQFTAKFNTETHAVDVLVPNGIPSHYPVQQAPAV